MAIGKNLADENSPLCESCGRLYKTKNSCQTCDSIVCASCFHHTIKVCKKCLEKRYSFSK